MSEPSDLSDWFDGAERSFVRRYTEDRITEGEENNGEVISFLLPCPTDRGKVPGSHNKTYKTYKTYPAYSTPAICGEASCLPWGVFFEKLCTDIP